MPALTCEHSKQWIDKHQWVRRLAHPKTIARVNMNGNPIENLGFIAGVIYRMPYLNIRRPNNISEERVKAIARMECWWQNESMGRSGRTSRVLQTVPVIASRKKRKRVSAKHNRNNRSLIYRGDMRCAKCNYNWHINVSETVLTFWVQGHVRWPEMKLFTISSQIRLKLWIFRLEGEIYSGNADVSDEDFCAAIRKVAAPIWMILKRKFIT